MVELLPRKEAVARAYQLTGKSNLIDAARTVEDELVQRSLFLRAEASVQVALGDSPHLTVANQLHAIELGDEAGFAVMTIALRPDLVPEVVAALSGAPSPLVHSMLARNRAVDVDLRAQLLRGLPMSQQVPFAADPELEPELAAVLVDGPHTRLMELLVDNPAVELTVSMRVSTLLSADRGRTFVDDHLAGLDAGTRTALTSSLNGTLEELRDVIDELGPASPRP